MVRAASAIPSHMSTSHLVVGAPATIQAADPEATTTLSSSSFRIHTTTYETKRIASAQGTVKMFSALANPRQAAAQVLNFALVLSSAFMVS